MLACIYATYFPFIAITYIIAWLDRKIGFPLAFPRDVNGLAKKQQWCVSKLKANGILPDDAEITDYKVTPLIQEIIFRSNAGIVEIHYASKGAPHLLKCFAKFAPLMGTVWNRTIFNLQLNHIKEIFFNRHFTSSGKIPAPKVFYADLSYGTGNLCLLTEYMENNTHYLDCAYDHFPDEHLQLALDGLAALHAAFWNAPEKSVEKILPIPDNAVYFFDSLVARSWSPAARTILVQAWRYMNEFQTVLHGDSRVGNMMFPSGSSGRFVFIDWQAVRRGRAAYDLAYFLILSLTAEHREAVEKQSVETYFKHLSDKGVRNYSLRELEEDYRHACLCILVLLSLPLLSGEASVQGKAALIFVFGMGVWRERLQTKFRGFDYQWLAQRYNITEQEGHDAVDEMLGVIENRLAKIHAENAVETVAAA